MVPQSLPLLHKRNCSEVAKAGAGIMPVSLLCHPPAEASTGRSQGLQKASTSLPLTINQLPKAINREV